MAKYFNLTSIFGAPTPPDPIPADAALLIESQGEVFKVPYSAVATPAPVQGVAVADAEDEAAAVTQLNALLASLRAAGVIAT